MSWDGGRMSRLDDFRAEKDVFFAHDPQSPLTPDQKREFVGLSYFSENANLRLEVSPQVLPERQRMEMQTSTGDVQTYFRHSRFRFLVDGREVELTIYEGPHGFFLPFVDSLAGKDTYPAGRYLEPEPLPNGRFLIDFNLAYNPYCAYNENWSCPLTPLENRLNVPIRAGEKLFGPTH
jgi:uncharacterized protein (DUF1684 family)